MPTSRDAWRILHDEWADYLAGRYLAHCLRFRMAEQIDPKACLQSMFRIAGEHLGNLSVDDTMVKFFFDHTAQPQHREGFAAGNFTATLGNSQVGMDGPALALMLEREGEVRGISRIVLLTSLGLRALRWREAALIRQVAPHFRKLVALGREGKTLPLVASLTWCYLSALGERDIGPWPGLNPGTPEQERELLLTIVSETDPPRAGTYRISPGNRSLQRAFLRIQGLITLDPFRPVSLVHYLYFLCAAHSVHAAVDEVGKALPGLLAEDSEMARRLGGNAVPELRAVFAACGRLYAAGSRSEG